MLAPERDRPRPSIPFQLGILPFAGRHFTVQIVHHPRRSIALYRIEKDWYPVAEQFQKAPDKKQTAQSRKILQDYTKLPEAVASTVPLPTYNFDIRAGDLDTWVKVLKDIGDFNGQVDTKKLVLSAR